MYNAQPSIRLMTLRIVKRLVCGQKDLAALGFVVLFLTLGCTTLPKDRKQPALDSAIASQPDGGFAATEAVLGERHGPGSGFLLLDRNQDALHWRLLLIDQARHSIDLQYYLWYTDASAGLLTSRLIDAADRGVRVRLIIDDFMTIGRETGLALLDEHPNIDLRLFNVWEQRDALARGLEYLEDIERLDTRMHNKLLIADNQATIIGGRNIGDHYFGLAEDYNFHDLDVLGVGPVARQASGIFDQFWNSDWVVSASALDDETSDAAMRKAHQNLREKLAQAPQLKPFAVNPQDWSTDLASLPDRLVPGTSFVIHDNVADGEVEQTMREPLIALVDMAEEEILVSNAYMIPTEIGIERARAQTDAGVRFAALTNSLASHDIALVNSHYSQWRKALVEAGVSLHEMRPNAAIKTSVVDTPPVVSEFVGLHAKAVVVDRQKVFIGSMNFDPRSAEINTEMGVIIDSPELAQQLALILERDMSLENSWRIEVNANDQVVWVSADSQSTEEPARDFGQRVQNELFKFLPDDIY